MDTAIAVAGTATRNTAAQLATRLDPPPLPWMARIEEHPAWEMLSQLRMTMRAEVPLNGFRVRDLLALSQGQVFETLSPDTEDVPLRIGDVQLGWSEFEVVEQRMALRVTRLD